MIIHVAMIIIVAECIFYCLESFEFNLVQIYPIYASLCCLLVVLFACFALLLKHFASLLCDVHNSVWEGVNCMSQHNKEDRRKAGKQQAHCKQNEYVQIYPLMAQAS